MSESSELFSFPKLSDTNYNTWKADMKVILMDRGSWEFITGDAKECAEDSSDKEKRSFQWRKQRSYC